MKKIILIFLIVGLLTACVSQKEKMNSWLGSTKQQIIMSWGPPARTASDGGTGEILIYVRQIYIPQSNMNFYDYKMIYVNSGGKIYHWLTQTQQVPPSQIDLNVYKRY
jgi:hypothetical protein